MYRITVAENSMPTDGKFVEVVGNYNPTDLNQPLVIQKDRVEYWISKGAKPTNTVAKLLNKQGFNLAVVQYHKAPKKVVKPAEATVAAPTAPVVEKPIEEAEVAPVAEQPVAEEVVAEATAEAEAEAPVVEVVAEAAPTEETSEGSSDTAIGVSDEKKTE